MSTTIGIDLGSTNSTAAVERNGVIQFFLFGDSEQLPSVVAVPPDGGLPVIGREAIVLGRRDPLSKFDNFKRMLGEVWRRSEDQGDRTTMGPDGLIWMVGPGADLATPETVEETCWAIEELAAEILVHIREAASEQLEEEITSAVIGVPTDFREPQRNAVMKAAKRAGFEQVSLINEPTAAALAYADQGVEDGVIAVYDFGGGTFDITLLRAGDGLPIVLASNGQRHLGGRDIDERLKDWILEQWRDDRLAAGDPNSAELATDDMAVARLLDEAQAVKHRLTDAEETTFAVREIARDNEGVPLDLEYPVDRQRLNSLAKPLIDRTIEIARRAVAEVKESEKFFDLNMIDHGIVVGGQTKMPAVWSAFGKLINKTPLDRLDPETVVARGAAILGAIEDGRRTDTTIQDKSSHPIALETKNDKPATLFRKGTPFGTEQVFNILPIQAPDSTPEHPRMADPNQRHLSLRLLEGDELIASRMTPLFADDVAIPGDADGFPTMLITAGIDKNGRPYMKPGPVTILEDAR